MDDTPMEMEDAEARDQVQQDASETPPSSEGTGHSVADEAKGPSAEDAPGSVGAGGGDGAAAGTADTSGGGGASDGGGSTGDAGGASQGGGSTGSAGGASQGGGSGN